MSHKLQVHNNDINISVSDGRILLICDGTVSVQFIWWKVVESLNMHTHTDMMDIRFRFNQMVVPSSTKMTRYL